MSRRFLIVTVPVSRALKWSCPENRFKIFGRFPLPLFGFEKVNRFETLLMVFRFGIVFMNFSYK